MQIMKKVKAPATICAIMNHLRPFAAWAAAKQTMQFEKLARAAHENLARVCTGGYEVGWGVSAGYKPIARPIPDERALRGNWHKLGVIKGANLATSSTD